MADNHTPNVTNDLEVNRDDRGVPITPPPTDTSSPDDPAFSPALHTIPEDHPLTDSGLDAQELYDEGLDAVLNGQHEPDNEQPDLV